MDGANGYVDIERNGELVPLTIQTEQLVARGDIALNIAANLDRTVPRFLSASGRAVLNREPLAIVSSGHSLNDQLDELREFKNILVCGSAHDHVVRAGITPTYAAVCDAGKEDKGNLSLPQKDTLYLIASQCDPGLFDHLADYRVQMWHYKGQSCATLEEEAVLLKGETAIAWGSTVTLTAVHLAVLLGHQQLFFFGFDNCYSEYGMSQHACEISGGYDYQKTWVTCGPSKRAFITNLALVEQVQQLFRLMEMWHEFVHITLIGDGLPHQMIRDGDPELQRYITLA